jgi:hypothetical protein
MAMSSVFPPPPFYSETSPPFDCTRILLARVITSDWSAGMGDLKKAIVK